MSLYEEGWYCKFLFPNSCHPSLKQNNLAQFWIARTTYYMIRQEESFSNAANECRFNRWNAPSRTRKASSRAKKEDEQRNARLNLQAMQLERELKSDAYQETIDALHIDFDSALLTFMDQLVMDSISQSHSHLANLAYRLDFNYFFSNGR